MHSLTWPHSLAVPALLACPLLAGQSPDASPLQDPKELMLAAARLANMTSSDMRPWHLKATFKILDEAGAPTDEGTLEEFWAGPKASRRIYAGKEFDQTEYSTEK